MKPDLHVTINADALEGDGKSKPKGGGSMHLRKSFRKRLADLSKSHPEDYEIPEETLPQPFGLTKQHMQTDTVKLPLSSSQGDEISEPKLDTACASLRGQLPVTPTKSIDTVENDDDLPTKSASIESTPTKLASTPARLGAETPALQPPKRCYMSPADNATSSLIKLARRPPSTRSLNKRTSSRPKKLSRCSTHPPRSNFDKEDPVNNGIVFIMDAHTFELYTSSLNKRTSSRPKKLSRCSVHPPQSNFDKEDPVNNGIGDDPQG